MLSYLAESKIKILNNGQTVRDYLYIDDFVNALCNIAFGIKQSPKIVNLCSGVGLNQLELIEVFNHCLRSRKLPLLDSNLELKSDTYDFIDISVLDPQLYISIFGEFRNVDIGMGFNAMVNSLIIDK